jgi:hypothetical protein
MPLELWRLDTSNNGETIIIIIVMRFVLVHVREMCGLETIYIYYSCSYAQLRATSCFVYQSYYMLINEATKKEQFLTCVNIIYEKKINLNKE